MKAFFRNRKNIIWLICAAAALLLALPLLYVVKKYPPDQIPFPMPVCIFHELTGLHCTGCGLTRGVHLLLNGKLWAAWRMNPLAFTLLPAGILYFVICRVQKWRHKTKPELPMWVIWGLVVVIVLFTVLRNIPVEPFTYLAPTELV